MRSVGSTLPNGTWEAKVRRKDGRKGPMFLFKESPTIMWDLGDVW
jgi:hypothetical protein